MPALKLSPPAPIALDHELADFRSGELSLDEWLQKRALKNQGLRTRQPRQRYGRPAASHLAAAPKLQPQQSRLSAHYSEDRLRWDASTTRAKRQALRRTSAPFILSRSADE